MERFFRQFTDNVIRKDSVASVNDLVTAINVLLAHFNLKPFPYQWKTSGTALLGKLHHTHTA